MKAFKKNDSSRNVNKEIKYTQSGYKYWILNPKEDDK